MTTRSLRPNVRPVEPNMETAIGWWPDQTDIWTPMGWKDHLFRFNVLYNGSILAQPCLNKRTEKFDGLGAQYVFIHSLTGKLPHPTKELTYLHRDDGMIHQGWNDGPAPVMWTEWSQDGLLLRQEVFAHIPGSGETVTGTEPLMAWVRLSVHDTCDALPLDDKAGFIIALQAPHVGTTMSMKRNIHFFDEKGKYPRKLHAERHAYSSRSGFHILENNGKVRLAVAANQKCKVEFQAKPMDNSQLIMHGDQRNYIPAMPDCSRVYVQLDARKGAHADLLLTMLPTDRATFDRELALGFDAARKASGKFWSRIPKTAAKVFTPEKMINDTITHNLRFAEVIAEKNPTNGRATMLTGSIAYSKLWATPNSVMLVMLLDALGHHATVEKYLQIFREIQGKDVAPGDCYKLHPGYLSTPRSLLSVDWLTDHGALLWAISNHGLITGDQRFISEWIDVILKASEFTRDARRIKGHGGVEGLLPAAQASDRASKIQAVWSDGWHYKGLATAVRLLKKIRHPRAAEFETEAKDYRRTFQAAFRKKTREFPKWKDAQGCRHPFAAYSLHGDTPDEIRSAGYLDAGPLFLVFAGLMDVQDPLMKSIRHWFRQGPQFLLARYDSNCWQVPHLLHEMSSFEPCYSWNIFHSHALGDRAHFLEGMYSQFAGSISRKTFTFSETRSARFGLTPCIPQVWHARQAVIDDQIHEGELHLLRLVPLAWLRSDIETRFENMPTEFGPLTLAFKLDRSEKSLHLHFKMKLRESPKRVTLHIPPLPSLARIYLNDKKLVWDGKAKKMAIEI